MTESGEKVGKSQIAAKQGISMVVMSRILMAAPGKDFHGSNEQDSHGSSR